MVNFYVRRIVERKLTIDDVPARWSEAVSAGVIDYYVERIRSGQMTLEDVPDEWYEAVKEALGNEDEADE